MIYFSKRWLHLIWVAAALVLVVVLWQGKKSDNLYKAAFTSPITEKIVCIDAGHGGFDSGARSAQGAHEDELNLKVALKLKSLFENHGTKVVMTRENDDALGNTKREDMQNRVRIIKESGADVVISIHMNKFDQTQYYGAQTFYMSGSEKGKLLAEKIQEKLIANLGRNNKRQAKAVNNLMILKAGSSPVVIVECGFLSNPEEAALLMQDDYQEKVAWSIYSGVIDYFTSQ